MDPLESTVTPVLVFKNRKVRVIHEWWIFNRDVDPLPDEIAEQELRILTQYSTYYKAWIESSPYILAMKDSKGWKSWGRFSNYASAFALALKRGGQLQQKGNNIEWMSSAGVGSTSFVLSAETSLMEYVEKCQSADTPRRKRELLLELDALAPMLTSLLSLRENLQHELVSRTGLTITEEE